MKNNIINAIKNDYIFSRLQQFSNFKDEIFVVGGFLRDAALNKKASVDRDIIVDKNCDVLNFAQEIAKIFDGNFIVLDNENEIYRIVLKNKVDFIDVTKIRGNCLADDLKMRDLTINSLCCNLRTLEIVDVTGGFDDIENGIIRCFNYENFKEDPLRMIRVLRFASNLGFEVEKSSVEAIFENRQSILECSKERIIYEMMKFFEGDYVAKTLYLLEKTEILDQILPCISEIKRIPKNSHHHLDLFHHLLESVSQVEILLCNCQDERIKQHFEEVFAMNIKRKSFLKYATFLHDIGKPSTWTIEPQTNRHRFIGHDKVGKEIVGDVLKDLKFPKKAIKYVQKLVENHIYPSQLTSSEDVSQKAINRLFRKLDEETLDVIFLAKADRLSARGKEVTEAMVKNNINNLENLQTGWFAFKKNSQPVEKLLDGNEIAQILNLSDKRLLGKIISDLNDAQLDGFVKNRSDAIEFLKDLSKNKIK